MRITDAPLAVLRFQYRIVRLPLQIIEERAAVARMGFEAPARLFYERSRDCWTRAVGTHWATAACKAWRCPSLSVAMRCIRAAQLDAAGGSDRTAVQFRSESTSDKADRESSRTRTQLRA